MPLLDLEAVKVYLRLDLDDTSEDDDLAGAIAAASRAIELRTGRVIDPADLPAGSLATPFASADLAIVKRAALLLVGDWYENRENSSPIRAMAELPTGVTWLIDPLRDYSDR